MSDDTGAAGSADEGGLELSTIVPPWSPQEFDALLDGLVADAAPRLFAVVQVYGELVDVRVAAWGMAFADRAEIVGVDSRSRLSVRTPESVIRWFARRPDITVRLVWVNPDAAGELADADVA
jgi:hypothetical protein